MFPMYHLIIYSLMAELISMKHTLLKGICAICNGIFKHASRCSQPGILKHVNQASFTKLFLWHSVVSCLVLLFVALYCQCNVG